VRNSNGFHDRRMDPRGGYGGGRGMPPQMMAMGYGSEQMYGRGPPANMRGGMYQGPPPDYGRMDGWAMGGMPGMYPPPPQMMGHLPPMNHMVLPLSSLSLHISSLQMGGGMYDGPPPQGWQRGPPQMPRVLGMSHESPFDGGGDDFRPHQHQHHQQQHQAPFEESATLKCTGIPRYVKEAELFAHFVKFGRIVKLALKRFGGADDPSGGSMDQKSYNECLVQFEEASDCRKCLSSPLSVLNNRFIKIFSAPHNIVPSAEVAEIEEAYPGAKQDEENGLWAGGGGGGHHSGRGRGGRMSGGRGRGRWSFGGGRDFNGGGEEHFGRRVDPNPSASVAQDQASSAQSANSAEEAGGGGDSTVAGLSERTSESRTRPDTTDGAPTAAQLEKERLRGMVQQKYDDLKSLRHRAEGIWRQKEDLLQVTLSDYLVLMVDRARSTNTAP
jgi:hypothetical protein